MYQSEEEFLANYHPDTYEKLSMTTDIAIISVADRPQENYRKTDKKYMSILLVKRQEYPFKDKWCLPGGFLDVKEDLEECPKRILEKETNIKDIYLEQLYTFGSIHRDPRMRVVSTAYMALIDKNTIKDTLQDNAAWFDLNMYEENNIVTIILENQKDRIVCKVQKVLGEHTTDRYAFETMESDKVAFDHPIVILSAMERLRNKLEYTDIVFNMMPEYFTLGELQQVYEVILNKKLLDPAFRRIIANKVEKTEKVKIGGGHRPSAMFRYKKKI